jgi:hypothetical protein
VKITSIRLDRMRLPLDPPFRAAWDPLPRRHFDATLVTVETDEGVTGYGRRGPLPSALTAKAPAMKAGFIGLGHMGGSRPHQQEPDMDGFTIAPKPAAHVGIGAVGQLPEIVRATGADQVVVMTDAVLAATPVIAAVQAVLADAGIPARLFAGVHPNPTTDDLAVGADAVARAAADATASASAAAVTATLKASAPPLSAPPAPPIRRITLVAVGGGSPIDAAKAVTAATGRRHPRGRPAQRGGRHRRRHRLAGHDRPEPADRRVRRHRGRLRPDRRRRPRR